MMIHYYQKGTAPRTLVLFHGTGGTEEDLVSIGHMLDPEAHILSLRGEVNENGMNRFFKRLAEGVFDEEDLTMRAKQILKEIEELLSRYELRETALHSAGYSNGANMIAGMLYLYGDVFQKSVLFHPMVPLKSGPAASLDMAEIFIGAGLNDPIVPYDNTTQLMQELTQQGAFVTMKTYEMGHRLTLEEVEDAKEWYTA
ncbi:alpha/beta hydrolase [Proteiniclasticum ruminis]|uniref:Phospholipase/carboxylesterase n=1 Tax=Proteiniclasticum ruminis TaxID=398199 RepID=A0A1G8N358_9CLOT|nr:alpha/beta hydrolase [Proteiniclasticum ruminis]SDI74618.1 phospholipase/carboxylesterase [Proteiniclasticum ruminis]